MNISYSQPNGSCDSACGRWEVLVGALVVLTGGLPPIRLVLSFTGPWSIALCSLPLGGHLPGSILIDAVSMRARDADAEHLVQII